MDILWTKVEPRKELGARIRMIHNGDPPLLVREALQSRLIMLTRFSLLVGWSKLLASDRGQ